MDYDFGVALQVVGGIKFTDQGERFRPVDPDDLDASSRSVVFALMSSLCFLASRGLESCLERMKRSPPPIHQVHS